MKESQCLLHLQRLFWTPFCLYFSARRPREILAAVRARAPRDDTICSKNRNFDPYHRDKARSRAYGLLPLLLLLRTECNSSKIVSKKVTLAEVNTLSTTQTAIVLFSSAKNLCSLAHFMLHYFLYQNSSLPNPVETQIFLLTVNMPDLQQKVRRYL